MLFVQPESVDKWPSLEKILSIVVSVSSLVYVLGLAAANVTFYSMGFQDPEIPHQVCVETGILFLLFLALTMTPFVVFEAKLPRFRNSKPWVLQVARTAIALFCAIGFVIVFTSLWQSESKHPEQAGSFWFLHAENRPLGPQLLLGALCSLLVSGALWVVKVFTRAESGDDGGTKAVKWFLRVEFVVLSIVVAFVPFCLILIQIPSALGGAAAAS